MLKQYIFCCEMFLEALAISSHDSSRANRCDCLSLHGITSWLNVPNTCTLCALSYLYPLQDCRCFGMSMTLSDSSNQHKTACSYIYVNYSFPLQFNAFLICQLKCELQCFIFLLCQNGKIGWISTQMKTATYLGLNKTYLPKKWNIKKKQKQWIFNLCMQTLLV